MDESRYRIVGGDDTVHLDSDTELQWIEVLSCTLHEYFEEIEGGCTMRNINVNMGDEVNIKAVVVDYNEGGDGMVKVRIEGLAENKADTASRYIWLYYDEIQHEKSRESSTPQHLPFNIGEVVYIIRNNKIEPGKIKSIVINEHEVVYWYEQAESYSEWKFSIKSIGHSVFKSYQEAADKLRGGDSYEQNKSESV